MVFTYNLSDILFLLIVAASVVYIGGAVIVYKVKEWRNRK